MDTLSHAMRLALRRARRHPLFIGVAVGSLAIGVGSTTIVFAVTDTVLLRPQIGVDAPERVVEIGLTSRGDSFGPWSYPDLVDLLGETTPLASAAVFARGRVNILGEEGGARVGAAYVSSAYFDVVGLTMSLGRSFSAAEDRGPGEHPIVVIGHTFWRDLLAGDPDVLGTTIHLNREPHTIVGVSREGFAGHSVGMDVQLILPVTQHPRARANAAGFATDRSARWSSVLGRLHEESSVEELETALVQTFSRLAQAHPTTNEGLSARAVPVGVGPVEDRGLLVVWIGVIGGLAFLILGVTASNVGGMLLARAAARRHEIVVQFALGANRRRVVTSLLLESSLVFVLGGAAGLLLANGLLRIDPNLLVSTPNPIPPTVRAVVDWRTVGVAAAITAGMGLVFGLIPALQATRFGLADTLRNELGASERKAGRLRRILVVGQVGVSMLLLTSAVVLASALQQGRDGETQGLLDRTLITPIDLSLEGYADAERGPTFLEDLLTRVGAMPDVLGATVATDFPLDNQRLSTLVSPDGRVETDRPMRSDITRIMPGYFRVLDLELRRGRFFTPEDDRLAPRVVIANESLAAAAWPGADPLGRQIWLGDDPIPYSLIGVVQNTKPKLASDPYRPQVFSLLAQDFDPRLRLAVVQDGDADGLVGRLRQAVLTVDPGLALSPTRTHRAYSRDGLAFMRVAATGASSLGMLAWILAGIGIYGIVAFSVTQRTREIGVRIALGATRINVLTLVLSGGVRLALPGLVVGGAVAVAATYVIRAGLLGASPLTATTLAAVGALFLALVMAACLEPARRASSVQPAEALRAS